MNRINTLPFVLLFACTLLIASCGGQGQSQADSETADTTDAEMGGDMTAPQTLTVAGTLIDTKCYGMNHANTGDEHTSPDGPLPGCATACANLGLPVAVLEGGQQDAKVYVLVASPSQLAAHMAKETRVTGTPVYDSGLLPQKVEVMNAAGEWEEVNLAAMM